MPLMKITGGRKLVERGRGEVLEREGKITEERGITGEGRGNYWREVHTLSLHLQ